MESDETFNFEEIEIPIADYLAFQAQAKNLGVSVEDVIRIGLDDMTKEWAENLAQERRRGFTVIDRKDDPNEDS